MKSKVKKGYYSNGKVRYEAYYLEGKRHRPLEEGPAYTSYFSNGQVKYEVYYLNDKIHRPLEEGPAWISYYENGKVSYEEYYLKGERINLTEEDLERLKFNKAFDLEVNSVLQSNS